MKLLRNEVILYQTHLLRLQLKKKECVMTTGSRVTPHLSSRGKSSCRERNGTSHLCTNYHEGREGELVIRNAAFLQKGT